MKKLVAVVGAALVAVSMSGCASGKMRLADGMYEQATQETADSIIADAKKAGLDLSKLSNLQSAGKVAASLPHSGQAIKATKTGVRITYGTVAWCMRITDGKVNSSVCTDADATN